MGLKCLYLLTLLLLLQETDANPGSCDSNPCKDGSTCEDRADNTHICLCETGNDYDYKEDKCISAKVFPGILSASIAYQPEMADHKSKEFKKAADIITSQLAEVYKNKPEKKYKNSIVLEINPPGKAIGAEATVVISIIFELSSPVTHYEVKNDVRLVGALTVTELCPGKPCDVMTTTCEENEDSVLGFTCPCKDKYVASSHSAHFCVACPSGEKEVEGTCVKCKFGYTGLDCADNWQLIFVIVASVLGAFMLIAIIVIPVVVVTSRKKIKKVKTTDFEKPYSNSAHDKMPQVNNGLAVLWPPPVQPGYGGYGVSRIQRAAPNDYWDRNTKQEMGPNNSRQNFFPQNSYRFDDHDDRNPHSRPMKQQNNLYGGGRPQNNLYASNQGYNNPYYKH